MPFVVQWNFIKKFTTAHEGGRGSGIEILLSVLRKRRTHRYGVPPLDCRRGQFVVKRDGKGLKGGGRHEEYAQGVVVQYSHTAGVR